MSNMNKWKRYRLMKKRLSAIRCAVCGQATLWEHRIRCPQLDSRSRGNLANISSLGSSTSGAPGECREMPCEIASHWESLPPFPQQDLAGIPVLSASQSAVSSLKVQEPQVSTYQEVVAVSGRQCASSSNEYADSLTESPWGSSMYLVVTFPVDNSVAVVHSSWLVDSGRVRWPRTTPFAQYQRLLLYRDELPNDTPTYDFVEVYHSDDLQDAIIFERGFIAKSGRFSDESTPMNNFSQRYSTKRFPTKMASETSFEEPSVSQINRRDSPMPSPTSGCVLETSAVSSSSPPNLILSASQSEDPETKVTPYRFAESTPSKVDADIWRDYFERVLSAINDVRYTVESISMGLDMCRRSSSPSTQYQPTRANTDRELMRLEADLTNVNNYKATVNALKRCSCNDVGTTVRRMLSSLIGEDLALRCNWMGTAGKTSVANHRFTSAVIDAVRCISAFQAESTLNIERAIKHWFTDARDRSYGRRLNRLKKMQESLSPAAD